MLPQSVMRTVCCLAPALALLVGGTAGAQPAETVRPVGALRASDPGLSVVLTPQAAERLAARPGAATQANTSGEASVAQLTRTQTTALLWATSIACGALGLACSPMPPPPTATTPPGAEAWRRAGCRSAETCGWLWQPQLPAPSAAASD
jgi:hypothetical protein